MPSPHALPITLSDREQTILQQIARRSTNPYRLVRRAELILFAAKGVSNTEIGQQLQLSRSRVRFWRERWLSVVESLTAAEAEGISDEGLMGRIVEVLNDQLRFGTPAHFSLEEIIQIVALACETPQDSQRPANQWTPPELAAEAVKRGIVKTISPRSVGRFLKRSQLATPPQPLLAQRQSR